MTGREKKKHKIEKKNLISLSLLSCVVDCRQVAEFDLCA